MMNARNKQKGVTLLEALIAVALLAALTTLLSPSVYSAMRTSTAILTSAERHETERTVDEALTQILSNAVMMQTSDQSTLFTGTRQSFEVTSLAGGNVARRFRIAIEERALIGQIAPLMASEDDVAAVEIMREGAGHFSYYGRATEDAPLGWSDQWKSSSPPQLIRFETMSNTNNGKRQTFEIAMRAQAPLHCAFDPVSRRCRS